MAIRKVVRRKKVIVHAPKEKRVKKELVRSTEYEVESVTVTLPDGTVLVLRPKTKTTVPFNMPSTLQSKSSKKAKLEDDEDEELEEEDDEDEEEEDELEEAPKKKKAKQKSDEEELEDFLEEE